MSDFLDSLQILSLDMGDVSTETAEVLDIADDTAWIFGIFFVLGLVIFRD